MRLCCPAALLPCCSAALLPCWPAALLLCCPASLLLCCSAALPCCSAALLPCCCVSLPPCCPAALLLCCSAVLCCPAALLPCSLNCALLCSALLCRSLLSALKIFQKNSSIWHLKCLQNGSQIDLGAHLGGREICSGRLWPLGRLLERSWTRLGPQKSNWNRLLDGPRPPRRSVSACLGAKWAPKRSPRRVPNRDPKAIRAENGKTLFFNDSCKDFNDFSGVRALFEGPKVGPKWGPNRIFDAEALEYLLGASWIALGALRSRKNIILDALRTLLGRSWRPF